MFCDECHEVLFVDNNLICSVELLLSFEVMKHLYVPEQI